MLSTKEFATKLANDHTKITMIEFFQSIHAQFYSDQDISFMNYFLELTEHEDEFYVHHDKLREYGIATSTESSDIRKRLVKLGLEKDDDYLLRHMSEQHKSGSKQSNQYYLTPQAFKKCFIHSPIMKAITGLTLRAFMYQCSKIITTDILDKHCDIVYVQYINNHMMMLCEYSSYIKAAMTWMLDAINQILKEDGIMQRFDRIEETLKEHGTILKEHSVILGEHSAILREHSKRFNDIEYMINPSIMTSGLLDSKDLKHQ